MRVGAVMLLLDPLLYMCIAQFWSPTPQLLSSKSVILRVIQRELLCWRQSPSTSQFISEGAIEKIRLHSLWNRSRNPALKNNFSQYHHYSVVLYKLKKHQQNIKFISQNLEHQNDNHRLSILLQVWRAKI